MNDQLCERKLYTHKKLYKKLFDCDYILKQKYSRNTFELLQKILSGILIRNVKGKNMIVKVLWVTL